MTKELHKAIMKRSRNKFVKTKSITDRKNIQQNYCKKLEIYVISTKKSYFNNLDISKISDNRSFRKTIVSLFWKKKLKK